MKFVCDRCGKRYTSADSPAPGHVYSIPCKACGNRITVRGADVAAPGGGPWPDEPSRRRRAASDGATAEPTPAPSPPRPAVREATPTPSSVAARGPPPIIARTPPPVPIEREPTIRDDPFAAAALAQRRAAAAPHIDPFADMPELSSEIGAGPLTDVPEIRGPIPTQPAAAPTPAAFDVRAAQHGLLIDEAKVKELARVEVTPSRSLADVLEPPQETAEGQGEEPIGLAQVPVARMETARPAAASARALKLGPRASRSRALPIALVAVAVVAAAGGGGYYYLTELQGGAKLRGLFGPTATPTATPTPTPPPPATPTPAAAPAPVAIPPPPGPTPAATPTPVQPVAEAPAPRPPPPAPPRAEPVNSRPRRRTTREERRAEAQARAAPAAEARVQVEREPPPPPAPKRAEPARAAAPGPGTGGDRSLLDLLGKKQDAPAGAPPPRASEGPGLQKSEVKAVISRSRKSFDACVEDWMRKEPGLDVSGIRVNLIITINPSGVVTAPVVDNPDIDRTTLGACLKSTARKMVFPTFGGDSFEASVPLVLGKGE